MIWWWWWMFAYERPGPSVRRATIADAPEMARLHAMSFDRPWSRLDIEALLVDPQVCGHVVTLGSIARPAGFVLSRIAADEAEILSVAISPAERRRGLARALLTEHTEALLRERVLTLFLEVEEGNEPALHLYRRHGFEQVGKRVGYYPKANGAFAEALIMRRAL